MSNVEIEKSINGLKGHVSKIPARWSMDTEEKNNAAFVTGGWVILQNSHLGIGTLAWKDSAWLGFWANT